MQTQHPDYTRTFAEVYLAELDYVKKKRDNMNLTTEAVKNESERIHDKLKELNEPPVKQSPDEAHPDVRISANAGIVGLALSGGGVRSATFNLGLLQGLDKRGILRYCDYLSTVSGGGIYWFMFEFFVDEP